MDNKPGAGVTVGTDAAAKAAPDGYTLFMGGSAVYLTKLLSKTTPFDVIKDFRVLMGVRKFGEVQTRWTKLRVRWWSQRNQHCTIANDKNGRH